MLDIIIPCLNRDNDLKYWSNLSWTYEPCLPIDSVILICQPTTHANIIQNIKPSLMPRLVFDYLSLEPLSPAVTSTISKSYLVRRGFRLSNADHIFFLDSDIRITPSTIYAMYRVIQDNADYRAALYLEKVFETCPGKNNRIYKGMKPVLSSDLGSKKSIRIVEWTSLGSRPGFGNILCSRTDYLKAGMHDLRYTTYGWEDHDLITALQLAGCNVAAAGFAFHISHSDHSRLLNGMTRDQSVVASMNTFLRKYHDIYQPHK